MVVRYEEILHLVTTLAAQEGLYVTAAESLKGGLITGTGAAVGGLLLGPIGLAVGGAAGGIAAAYFAAGKFKSVSDLVSEDLTEEQRRRLASAVQDLVANLDAGDAVTLLALVQGNAILKSKIVAEITSFLARQLNLTVSTRPRQSSRGQ